MAATTSTQRLTRARRLYTGEPHASALSEVRSNREVLPAASTDAQQDLEARVLAALVAEFGVHRPGKLDGPFALAWVGPREDSLVLVAAEPHRERVARCLLEAGGLDGPGTPGLERRRASRGWIALMRESGGTLLLPHDHGPALLRALEDRAARPTTSQPEGLPGALPAWVSTPSERARASTVLRRIRLFAGHDTVDFQAALPGDAVLAGPHPELLVRNRRPRVIAVVNSKGGHGCSSLAAGLAQALAGQQHRVLYLVTSRSGQGGPGLQQNPWPEADPGLATVAQDPDRHIHPMPGLGHSFVRCSAAGADGPDQGRQLALLLRHPAIDRAFSHVVIDASPTGLPHAAARTADLTLVPWRHMPRLPDREVTDVNRTPQGEIWAWLEDAYRNAEPAELEDWNAYEERLEQFAREHGAQPADDELEDGLARRMFLRDTDDAGRQRWGARWEEARDGWLAHLLREETTGWDQAAAIRTPRTLTDQEWEAALHSRVAKAADELLWNLRPPPASAARGWWPPPGCPPRPSTPCAEPARLRAFGWPPPFCPTPATPSRPRRGTAGRTRRAGWPTKPVRNCPRDMVSQAAVEAASAVSTVPARVVILRGSNYHTRPVSSIRQQQPGTRSVLPWPTSPRRPPSAIRTHSGSPTISRPTVRSRRTSPSR
ncbi:hypothetical protein ABZW47_30985 [Streptomyces sp. NPDC004549]|uniref:hypothetical protein n=1 Tax=Streptomyces sp. NPDC004549 TaxID=3154283 RepID=UPI0033B79FAF